MNAQPVELLLLLQLMLGVPTKEIMWYSSCYCKTEQVMPD